MAIHVRGERRPRATVSCFFDDMERHLAATDWTSETVRVTLADDDDFPPHPHASDTVYQHYNSAGYSRIDRVPDECVTVEGLQFASQLDINEE